MKAIWQIIRCKFIDPQFTDHAGFYTLKSMSRSNKYNRWIVDLVRPFLGRRVLEAGSGIGNISSMLVQRERLVLTDNDPVYMPVLEQRFGRRSNVRVDCGDLQRPDDYDRWEQEELDTVFCSNVLEHLERRRRRAAQLSSHADSGRTLHHRGSGRQGPVHADGRAAGALPSLYGRRADAKDERRPDSKSCTASVSIGWERSAGPCRDTSCVAAT